MTKKYYRTILPRCILNLVGEFSGTADAILLFTLTPKRRFLGDIYIVCPHRKFENRMWKRKLRKDLWMPTSFVSSYLVDQIITKLVRHMYWNIWDNGVLYKNFIGRVERLFNETNNYALLFPREV